MGTITTCREIDPIPIKAPVADSPVTWQEWDLHVVAAETSLDDGQTWHRVENGEPVPMLHNGGPSPDSVRARLFFEARVGLCPSFRVTISCDYALAVLDGP